MSPTETAAAVRVLIADDQTLFRSGLARLLDADPRIQVVGQAIDGPDAVRQAEQLQPDLVMMDYRMPTFDGVEATRRILARQPGVKVLMLTTFDGDSHVMQAMRAGASGYILKDSRPEAIVSSILAVLDGAQVLAEAVTSRVVERLSGGAAPGDSSDGLSGREVEILTLLAQGCANKQIARQLHISEKTARNHVSHVYGKLGIDGRAEAVLYAIRKRLIEP